MASGFSYMSLAELSDLLLSPDQELLELLLALDSTGLALEPDAVDSELGDAELPLNEHAELPPLDSVDVLRLLSDTLLSDCVDGLLPDSVLHELDELKATDDVLAELALELELLLAATVLLLELLAVDAVLQELWELVEADDTEQIWLELSDDKLLPRLEELVDSEQILLLLVDQLLVDLLLVLDD